MAKGSIKIGDQVAIMRDATYDPRMPVEAGWVIILEYFEQIQQMSDEPSRPGEEPPSRERGTLGHICERTGCGKDAGWGFGRPKHAPHWFCFKHRAEGEDYL